MRKVKKVKTAALQIEINTPSWRGMRGLRAYLTRVAQLTLERLPKKFRPVAEKATMTLLLTSNKSVQHLNRDYRGLDKPTNVLSFPQFTPRELTKMGKKTGGIYMGDIAIAYQYIVVEARKEHKILINHLTHLMIHGILHLFGYDHPTAVMAVCMEQLEKKLMAELGLPNPYAPLPAKTSSRRIKRSRP